MILAMGQIWFFSPPFTSTLFKHVLVSFSSSLQVIFHHDNPHLAIEMFIWLVPFKIEVECVKKGLELKAMMMIVIPTATEPSYSFSAWKW